MEEGALPIHVRSVWNQYQGFAVLDGDGENVGGLTFRRQLYRSHHIVICQHREALNPGPRSHHAPHQVRVAYSRRRVLLWAKETRLLGYIVSGDRYRDGPNEGGEHLQMTEAGHCEAARTISQSGELLSIVCGERFCNLQSIGRYPKAVGCHQVGREEDVGVRQASEGLCEARYALVASIPVPEVLMSVDYQCPLSSRLSDHPGIFFSIG